MSYKNLAHALTGLLLWASLAGTSSAGISVGGTRVIFDGSKREASVSIRNIGTTPFVVQTWIDATLNEHAVPGKAPLIVTPPLSRLDGGKENLLRIMVSGNAPLPPDRESVFWLNVKEIPPATKGQNVLQIALNTRIKVFYRPQAIAKYSVPASDAPSLLKWSLVPAETGSGSVLKVNNPTPYHVTLAKLAVNGDEIKADMVPPYDNASYPLTLAGSASGAPLALSYLIINDYGGTVPFELSVPRDGASATVAQ